MKSILHQLYDGEIAPWEQFTTTLTDCRAKRQEHLRHYESLRRTLTEEQRKELEEVMDEQLALFPLEQAESFIKGFRLGAGIMIEVLSPPAKEKFPPPDFHRVINNTVDIIHIKNCVFHSMKCGNVDNFFVRVEKRCVLSDFTAGFLWKDSCFPRYCLILWKTIHIKNRIKNRISGILLILGFRSHSFSARK